MVKEHGWFFGLVAAFALQRLWELSRSRRNEQALRARGGAEHAPRQMPWMIALHVTWLVAMVLEVAWLQRTPSLQTVGVACVLLVSGQTLRLWAIHTLGPRWCVKIVTLPDEPPVTSGPFRYLRHPNYWGVMLETLALPLMGGAVVTALVFSGLNACLLAFRIHAEERALSEGTDYAQIFRTRRRWSRAK